MYKKIDRKKIKRRKHLRIRKKIEGTPERPRLNVFRSNKYIYAQLIDDMQGYTLVSASSLDPQIKELDAENKTDEAKKVGQVLAEKAVERGIKNVVFDRGGNIYRGRIAALANGARENGLEF